MENNNISQPHDRFFRQAMSNKQVAREFFESHLPADIISRVNLSTLKEEKESFLDQDLKQSIVDMLFSVQFDKEKGYFYLLVEHQTKSDYWMAFRIAKYIINIQNHHLQSNPKAKHLPLVYPMIFYSGTSDYNVPRDLWQLFADPILAKAFFTDPYRLIELQKIEDEQLRHKAWSGAMEIIMKRVWVDDILPFLKMIEPMLAEISKHNIDYFHHIVYYTLTQSDSDSAGEVIEAFKRIVPIKEREGVMTIADRLREEGRQQGRQEGVQQGRQEGVQQAVYNVAKNMLVKGRDIELIVEATGLSEEEIQHLRYNA